VRSKASIAIRTRIKSVSMTFFRLFSFATVVGAMKDFPFGFISEMTASARKKTTPTGNGAKIRLSNNIKNSKIVQ